MSTFRISNQTSGLELGLYEGRDAADALDEMARDAGYTSYAESVLISVSSEASDEEKERILEAARADMIVTRSSEVGGDKVALAAPDLLAALKRMEEAERRQQEGAEYDYSNAVLEARAAIAKAEGRS